MTISIKQSNVNASEMIILLALISALIIKKNFLNRNSIQLSILVSISHLPAFFPGTKLTNECQRFN